MKLNAKKLSSLKKPGRYGDGHGLYLQIMPSGVKSWLLRYERDGRERWLGLGPLHTFSLAEARERARKARQQLLDGIDPVEAKRQAKAERALAAAKTMTFEEAAREYHKQNEPRWKNKKVVAQWLKVMEDYVFPVIGRLAVGDIDTGLVLKVLEREHPKRKKSLWLAVPETAGRIRQRIENVLDWATTRGYRAGENPARWRGHLDNVLPAHGQVVRVEHHPALPYGAVPAFVADLRLREGIAARALELTILTAARTGEVIGAKWDEVDLDNAVWTVPVDRMKGGKQHRVPLSDRAVELLKALPREDDNEHIFIGPSKGAGLSNMAMAAVLKRMGRDGITVHGFRSTFRDWAAETTGYDNHIVEMALAHVIGNAVEKAYRRGDLFAKRRRLMDDWAHYCAIGQVATEPNVMPIRRAR